MQSALLLAGCKLGPDYRRPDTKTPPNYRFDSSADAASLADEGWWQVYQDPRLQQLIREALANNLDVAHRRRARRPGARRCWVRRACSSCRSCRCRPARNGERTSQFELLPGLPRDQQCVRAAGQPVV